METRLGILLWSQATEWDDFKRAAIKMDGLGYEHLWTWDRLYATFGDPYQPIFEGYASLGAWAKVTSQARLGLLVGANTFRSPGLVATLVTTLDHISGGRAILGIGGAWFQTEHAEYGIEFGASPGTRLRWMDEATPAEAKGRVVCLVERHRPGCPNSPTATPSGTAVTAPRQLVAIGPRAAHTVLSLTKRGYAVDGRMHERGEEPWTSANSSD